MSLEPTRPTPEEWFAFLSGRLAELEMQRVEAYLEKYGTPAEFEGLDGQAHDDSFLKSLRHSVQANRLDNAPMLDHLQAEPTAAPSQSDMERLLQTWPELRQRGEQQATVKDIRIGPYRVLEQVNQSRMGRVYLCVHEATGGPFALKCPPQILGERTLERFEREIKITQKLRHPQIVTVVDELQYQNLPVFVMPWVDGMDLSRLLARMGHLVHADVAEIGYQLAGILKYLKQNGVVHRDIKPSNLILTESGQLKLIDLGLALLRNSEITDETYTESVQIIGSLDYLAPEQARDAHSADYRADIYSMGCTLFKLATGKAPFENPGQRHALQKVMAHALDPFPEVDQSHDHISQEFTSLLKSLCAKRPEDRLVDLDQIAARFKKMAVGADLRFLYQNGAGSNATSERKPTKPRAFYQQFTNRLHFSRRKLARAGLAAAAGVAVVSERERLGGLLWNPADYLFAEKPSKWLNPHAVFVTDGNLGSIHVIDHDRNFEVTRFTTKYTGWNLAVTRSGRLFLATSQGKFYFVDLWTNFGAEHPNLRLDQDKKTQQDRGSGGMVYVDARSLYVTGRHSGRLYKIDTTTMQFDRSFGDGGFVTVGEVALGVDHDRSGNIYVACKTGVTKVSPNGKTVDRAFITGLKRVATLGGFTVDFNNIYLADENRVLCYSLEGGLLKPRFVVWDHWIDNLLFDRELDLMYVSSYSYVNRVDVFKLDGRGVPLRQIPNVGLNLAQMTLPVAD